MCPRTSTALQSRHQAAVFSYLTSPAHAGLHGTGSDDGDQAAFRLSCKRYYKARVHAPHVSRWFNPKTKAPMDMPPDLVAAFESFTGWRGLTQRFNRTAETTCLEEMQARMSA